MVDAPLLAGLIAAVPLPTLVIDRGERILALNAAAEALLGRGAQGRHFVTVLRQPRLVEAVERCLADLSAINAPYLAGEGGRDVKYDVHLRPVARTGMVMVSFQDMTHMAEAGQMRRDFVANVSHELRTPLTSLMGFIETLGGPARDNPMARDRFLAIMQTEAERMNRLVGDLLSLSRVEAEERVRPRTEVDLTDVLRTTLRNLTPMAVENDVEFRPDFGSDTLPILGDADQLLQVFTNLVENAIKYGGAGRPVDIVGDRTSRDATLRSPAVQITVRDHGPGIEAHHLPRLTERFYRVDSHRSRSLGGTGLGLAIVKHIVTRHRGRLRITSQPGSGAAFCVTLPLHAAGD